MTKIPSKHAIAIELLSLAVLMRRGCLLRPRVPIRPVLSPACDHRRTQKCSFEPNGARHASELPYVFRQLTEHSRPAPTPKDESLSDMMRTYWTNFAKTLLRRKG